MSPAWEVDGERCEQITVLIGWVGFCDATINQSGKPISLGQVKEMIRSGELESFGEVAGYPKLPLGFWDDDDFCVLQILIIFKGLTGADPAWLNFVHDKTRVMVACTETGYINTSLKYEWYSGIGVASSSSIARSASDRPSRTSIRTRRTRVSRCLLRWS